MQVVHATGTVLRVSGRVLRLPLKALGIGLSRRTWILWYTGYLAAALVKAVARKVKQRRDAYSGLDGIISFSACLIAAMRAAESEREDRFIYDPLASLLAGRKALARHKLRPHHTMHLFHPEAPVAPAAPPGWSPPSAGGAGTAARPGAAAFSPPARPVPRLVMRTRFFDDAVLAATWGACRAAPGALAGALGAVAALAEAGHGPCQQVVMLGAGMDTRPWRLPLPAHVSWFEVDRQDVLAAKVATLSNAGVQLRGKEQGGAHTITEQLSDLVPSTVSLKAARWNRAACDLQVVGWTQQLELQGLDLLQPTCWVAEGLLYYLEPSAVAAMLKEAAAASAPGSVLIVNTLTESGLSNLKRRAAERKAAEAEGPAPPAPPAAPAEPAGPNGTAGDGRQAGQGSDGKGPTASPKLPPRPKKQQQQQQQQEQQQGGGGGVSAGSASAAKVKGPGPKHPLSQGPSLTEHFQFGCPDNVEAFMASNGWTVVQRASWRQMARAYGWVPERSRFAGASEGGDRSAGAGANGAADSGANGGGDGDLDGGDGGVMPPEQEVQFLVAVSTF